MAIVKKNVGPRRKPDGSKWLAEAVVEVSTIVHRIQGELQEYPNEISFLELGWPGWRLKATFDPLNDKWMPIRLTSKYPVKRRQEDIAHIQHACLPKHWIFI